MPLVNVNMARGRTAEQKAALLRAIADAVEEHLGAPRDSIRVWVTEFEADDFLAGDELLSEKRARLAGEAGASPT